MWRTIVCLVGLAAIGFRFVAAAGLESGRPLDVCKPHITDDRPTPLPAWLVSRAKHLFQIDMPDGLIQKTTVYRCLNGKTLLCMAGANLACGKANTNRDLPSVADWCRDHTESDSVPMFVTGHDTVYRWHCSGGRPRIDATAETVDARGFIARNWKDAGLN